MNSDVQFGEIFEAIWTMDIAKRVNTLFDKMGTPTLDPEALDAKINGLSDEARAALIQAIKRKEMDKIVGILGVKPITYVNVKEE